MAVFPIKAPLLYTAATILPSVGIIVVASRFVARKVQKIAVCGTSVTIIIGTAHNALGHPSPKVPLDQVLNAISLEQAIVEKCFVAVILLNTASLTFIKLSVMLFYKRMFGIASKKHVKWTVYIANVVIIAWGTIFFFAFLFACGTKLHNLWSSTSDVLKCHLELPKIELSLAITDVVMDIFILLYPIPLILPLQISAARKAALLAIFTLGASAIGASVTRLVIVKEELGVWGRSYADEDFEATDVIYFMHIEAGIALVAINLPSIAGLLKAKSLQRAESTLKSLLRSARFPKRNDSGDQNSWGNGKISGDLFTPGSDEPTYESRIEAQPYNRNDQIPPTDIIVVKAVRNIVDKRPSYYGSNVHPN